MSQQRCKRIHNGIRIDEILSPLPFGMGKQEKGADEMICHRPSRIGIGKKTNLNKDYPIYIDTYYNELHPNDEGKAILDISHEGIFYILTDYDLKQMRSWINRYFEYKDRTRH